MKTMAGMFLWALIIGYFIQYAKQFRNSHDYRRNSSHSPEDVGEGPLTTADVEAAFALVIESCMHTMHALEGQPARSQACG